jgi:hypothetical protein
MQTFWLFHKRSFLLVIVLMLALVVSACMKDDRVKFIQGTWHYKDAHIANIPAESSQVTDWVFDNYYFSMSTCCFYEAYFSGNYNITERDENEITLELFNMHGQYGGTILYKNDTLQIVIEIDPETDQIEISGDGPYTRISPDVP